MNTQNLGQKVLIGLALLLGVVGAFKTPTFTITDAQLQTLRTNLLGTSNSDHTNNENFFGGVTLGQGFAQGVPASIETGGGSLVISTTTSMCIIRPPVATSTIEQARLRITTASTNTTVIAFGTSTNPYATTTMTSLGTVANLTGATRPMVYNGGANMFQLPTEYGIFYYTSLTTNDSTAQGQAGSCSELFGQF